MPTIIKDILWILIPSFTLTALAVCFGWDASIAQTLYHPENEFAWSIRQYSNIPGAVISIFFMVFLLLPWRKKFPTLRRTGYVWLFAMILGGGLLMHVVLKDMADRPRPRETVLLGGDIQSTQLFDADRAELKGKSFPSGHVAMAAAFLIPVFTLRRRRKKTAIALGVVALGYAGLVSWARMTLGAHFFTDCLWAISVIALFSAIGVWFIKEESDIKSRYIIAFLAFVIFCLAWFNKFKLTLSYTTGNPAKIERINLPCPLDHIRTTNNTTLRAEVTVTGFGAPLSWLALAEKDGEIYLKRNIGLFHKIQCTVDGLTLPANHPLLQKALQ